MDWEVHQKWRTGLIGVECQQRRCHIFVQGQRPGRWREVRGDGERDRMDVPVLGGRLPAPGALLSGRARVPLHTFTVTQ